LIKDYNKSGELPETEVGVKLAAFVLVVLIAPVVAQSELEVSLFVQNPPGSGVPDGMRLLWLPQPVEQYCMGKTAQQCIDIDYCMRVSNKKTRSCLKVGVDVTLLPAYPPDVRPRRVLSVLFFKEAPIKGMDKLAKYFDSRPKEALERLSGNARVRARIRLVRTSDDDGFELLEVLGGI